MAQLGWGVASSAASTWCLSRRNVASSIPVAASIMDHGASRPRNPSMVSTFPLNSPSGEVAQQGSRLDTLTGEVETLGREVRKDLWELPAQLLAGVMAGIERSAYATDLRALQARRR